jgi:hypothetical protein
MTPLLEPRSDGWHYLHRFPVGVLIWRREDGRVLFLGGATNNGTKVLDTAELFDPATSAFTPVANKMTTPRIDLTATLLPDGHVLVVGGREKNLLTHALATAELPGDSQQVPADDHPSLQQYFWWTRAFPTPVAPGCGECARLPAARFGPPPVRSSPRVRQAQIARKCGFCGALWHLRRS